MSLLIGINNDQIYDNDFPDTMRDTGNLDTIRTHPNCTHFHIITGQLFM